MDDAVARDLHRPSAQIAHWDKLTGCGDPQSALNEQASFTRELTSDIGESLEAMGREARIAVAA
jgi:hypothetical protein